MPIKDYKNKVQKIPKVPGVYFFKDVNEKILYIGKAINLQNRVRSYFVGAHDRRIEQMLKKANKLEWKKVGSAIEALVLEANLIRKYKPQYNAIQKDDKTFIQIGITQEDFPRVIVVRKTALKGTNRKSPIKYKRLYGPFTSAHLAKTAIKILRKIFPFRTKCKPNSERKCFDAHIGLCPGVCSGEISKQEYAKIIKQLILFFEGGKKQLVRDIECEMKDAAKKQNFEQAAKLRNQIFSLNHIHDVALIKDENFGYLQSKKIIPNSKFQIQNSRIEAYDISHTGGKYSVGSMVVFTHGKIDTDEYRQFRIRAQEGVNDTAHLQEILERRLAHTEWQLPDVILVDGGLTQFRAAKKALSLYKLDIPILALAKGPTRKGKKIFLTKNTPKIQMQILEGLRDEAHRFAIKYHRRLRRRGFIKNKK